MNLGAEPKKIAILVGLLAVAIVVFFINSSSDGGSTPAAARPATSTGVATALRPESRESVARNSSRGRGPAEFRPSLKPKRGEERIDPMSIDPTLQLAVLTKLQVNVEGTHRNIFEFGAPPPPKPDPKQVAAAKVPSPLVAPPKPEDEKPPEPVKPQAPPVPFKFFGYTSPTDQPRKRAFFMEGDDIHVVSEGEVVKKRYKIVRIGINSVTVEDIQFPDQPQTVPLIEATQG